MVTKKRAPLLFCTVFLLAPLALHFAMAQQEVATVRAARRYVPPLPDEAARAHSLRFRVLKATFVEQVGDEKLLRLEVKRHYGKIETESLNRAKEHESQTLSILFPAALDADVRPGDIVTYWLVGYLALGRE